MVQVTRTQTRDKQATDDVTLGSFERFSNVMPGWRTDASHPTIRSPFSSAPLRFKAGSRCAKGAYRNTNEDKCYADVNHRIFLVADGMGGHYGGETASGMAVKILPEILESVAKLDEVDCDKMKLAFEEAVHTVRRAMARYARRRPMYAHMGTTLAAAVIVNDVAYATAIGDCRLYHVRRGELQQVTKDQTMVQAFVDAKCLTPEEARTSPQRHIVTNSVRVKELDEQPVVHAIKLKSGDRLILTTDGLSDALPNEEIERLSCTGGPQDVADTLALEALRQGSRDNVSCVVVKAVPGQLGPF